MKGSSRLDILLLLSLLLLFGVGVSLLYGKGPTPLDMHKIEDNKVLMQLSSLFASHSITKIADFLDKVITPQQQVRIINQILDNNKQLLAEEKISLVLMLMAKTADQKQRLELLDLMLQNKKTAKDLKEIPLLYLALDKNYDSVVQTLIDRLSVQPNDLRTSAYDALTYAINNNNTGVANKLLSYKNNITGDDATTLLWEVVNKNKSELLVNTFIKMGAIPNDSRAGKTLLITAVENNEQEVVDALLANGADINLIKDPAIGSALQTAIRKGYTPIELLLRQKGARE